MVCPLFDVATVMNQVALTSGSAVALLFAYKVKFPSTLFSWHPTLLGLGWLALTPYAIKYLRESKKETNVKAKTEKVQMHAYLNAAVAAFTAGGLFAIARNKEIMAASKNQVAKHLVSIHAKVGALGASLALLAFSTSIYRTYFAASGSSPNYVWRDKIHRILGMLAYVTCGLSILLIVNGPWGKFNLGVNGQRLVSLVLLIAKACVVAPFFGTSKA